METLFAIGVAAYVASTAGYLVAVLRARGVAGRVAHGFFGLTLLFWAVLLVAWAVQEGAGLRLWLGASAWSLGGLYLLLLRRYPISALGSVVSALGCILSVFALVVAQPSSGPTGAVSDWLLRIHITLAFIGVTAFGFATAVSVLYVVEARMLKQKVHSARSMRRLPPLQMLDRLAFRGIAVGFPFYTVALLLGSGSAIRWEGGMHFSPAYALAGLAWLIYGGVLQARLAAGWRGRRAALLTIAGFLVALAVVAWYVLRRLWL